VQSKKTTPSPPTALESLDGKCREGASLILRYGAKAEQLLAQHGILESAPSVIRHVDQSIPPSAPVQPCSDVFAAYVTLREGGG
jgi:hypothetical protein